MRFLGQKIRKPAEGLRPVSVLRDPVEDTKKPVKKNYWTMAGD
jgi:hypothetical protein